MANYAQINAGLRQMQNVGAGILDYQTNQRALDIRQQDVDLRQDAFKENMRRRELEEMGNLLNAANTELSTLRRKEGNDNLSLNDLARARPELFVQMADHATDRKKYQERAKKEYGGEYIGPRFDEDDKIRLYYRDKEGNEKAFDGKAIPGIGATPEQLMFNISAKAAAGGYLDGLSAAEVLTPDQPGVPAAEGGGLSKEEIAKFTEITGAPPSVWVKRHMDGDTLAELEAAMAQMPEQQQPQAGANALGPKPLSAAEQQQLEAVMPEQTPEAAAANAADRAGLREHMDRLAASPPDSPASSISEAYAPLPPDEQLKKEEGRASAKWIAENGFDLDFVKKHLGKSPEEIDKKYGSLQESREQLRDQQQRAEEIGNKALAGQFEKQLAKVDEEIGKYDKHFFKTSSQVSHPNPTGTTDVDQILGFVEREEQSPEGQQRTPTQKQAIARSWVKQFEAAGSGPKMEGRFKDNSKQARADRAFIYGSITKNLYGQADRTGMMALTTGDDAMGSAMAKYQADAKIYKAMAEAQVKYKEKILDAERKNDEETRKIVTKMFDDFPTAFVGEGKYGKNGFENKEAARDNLIRGYYQNLAIYKKMGFPPRHDQMTPVQAHMFLKGMEQAMRLNGMEEGGFLGWGSSKRNTRYQSGTDGFPPLLAGSLAYQTAMARNPEGVGPVFQRLLAKHKGNEMLALEELGDTWLNSPQAGPLIKETADE